MKKRSFRLDVGTHRIESDVDKELEFHLAMRAETLAARGISPESASAEALRRFGDLGAVRDECVTIDRERDRTMRRLMRIDDLRQDTAFAFRALRKRPAFTAIVLAILALGIGANTAMFSIVDALVLRGLPVREPSRLVTIGNPALVGSLSFGPPRADVVSWPLFRDIRDASGPVFSGIYASGITPGLDVIVERGPDGGALPGAEVEHPRGRLVSGAYWRVLGVGAARGRTFGEEADAGPGAAPEIVISHGWWTRRFGADPAVIGRSITVNDVPLTIVGVAPESFTGDVVGSRPDLWMPVTMQPLLDPRSWLDNRGASWLMVMGRLAPGVTIERARQTLTPAIQRTIIANATGDDLLGARETLRREPVRIEPGARGFSRFRQSYASALVTLGAAVALVLLVACANVANLMLARATSRAREMSVRLAVGASRGRLVMQLLVESLVLATAGGALGIALGWWGSKALLRLASSGPNPIPLAVRVDGNVLLFTAALSVGTAILFGLAPAVHSTRVELATALRGSANAVTGGPRSRLAIGRALVVGQVALSLLLLVATAMLVRSMQRIDQVDLGVARDNLLVAEVNTARTGYEGEKAPVFLERLLASVKATPGVLDATFSQNGIFSGIHANTGLQVEGFTARTPEDTISDFDVVGPNYARAIGATLLRGRDIAETDRAGSEKVAIVNEAFARHFFPGDDAVGRSATFDSITYRIVGVIRNVQADQVRGEVNPRIYLARMQSPVERMGGGHRFIVRTSGDPNRMVEPITRAMKGAIPTLSGPDVETLPAMVRDTVLQDRLVAKVVAFFGFLTLLLASLGLYGVMAYATARREREFGLRMALGATSGNVVRLVLRDAFVLLAIGIAIGLPASLAAVRVIRAQLFGVELIDPPSIVLALLALGTAIVLAGWLPARRAAGVQPDVALRAE